MTAYLSLGSNLGDKEKNLERAKQLIVERAGAFSAISSVYKTAPWGFESEHFFLNQMIAIETKFSPEELLILTQAIEKDMGRTQKSRQGGYQDRLIDIDLILYDDRVECSENLELPHPLFHQRQFVLEPLNEIAPDLVHPVLKQTVSELLHSYSGACQK
jgi:2-amino-4-hydroxy-6-hydroxymethyldihydropteridine diphosphokinase